MDIVDLITEKRFLGQEFLTWLWYRSELHGGTIRLENQSDIIVVFEKHMVLEYGEADYHERLVCSGLQTELREARTGLRTGKKLEQARLLIGKDDHEWAVTVGASLFEFRNVRLPKTAASTEPAGDSEAEIEGMILERIYLFEALVRIINDLFRQFLTVRLADQWEDEVQAIRHWVHKSADDV